MREKPTQHCSNAATEVCDVGAAAEHNWVNFRIQNDMVWLLHEITWLCSIANKTIRDYAYRKVAIEIKTFYI